MKGSCIFPVLFLALIFLTHPTWGYRLKSSSTSTGGAKTGSELSGPATAGDVDIKKSDDPAAWPPSIPMWGFLPSKGVGVGKKMTRPAVEAPARHPTLSFPPPQHPLTSNDVLDTEEMALGDDEDLSASYGHGQPMERLVNLKRSSTLASSVSISPSRKHDDVKRVSRPYDVPQIECPLADDGMERFACPTPDTVGRYRCVDDHVLCDGFIDCPNAEDEDRQACMFYKTTKAHLDVLADALLRWARGKR